MAIATAYLQQHAQEIEAAAGRIAPHVRRTPLLETDLGAELLLKPECFQPTGSFKVRGAFNAVLKLTEDGASRPKGVIAVSSGNHARALALAARTAELPATILIPHDANPAKIAATRALGATVITENVTFANREERLHEVLAETGFTLVHPFDNWDIVHGQGTATREIIQDRPDVEVVYVPTGGGGLLTGTALAAKSADPRIRVIGVEPANADDAAQTFKTGHVHKLQGSPSTIADGVRTVAIGERTFEVAVSQGLVDDIVTVTEEEIAEATRLLWTVAKLAVEPTAALPLAGHLHDRGRAARSALILSGGNFDPALISRLLTPR